LCRRGVHAEVLRYCDLFSMLSLVRRRLDAAGRPALTGAARAPPGRPAAGDPAEGLRPSGAFRKPTGYADDETALGHARGVVGLIDGR